MSSFKMHMVPLWTYEVLCSWSDIELEKSKRGTWEPRKDGHDPMRHYISLLDHIRITGKVPNYLELCNLIKDLKKTRDDFIRVKIEGIEAEERKEKLLEGFRNYLRHTGTKMKDAKMLAIDYILEESGMKNDMELLMAELNRKQHEKGGNV